jgi:hypothetical protein
MRSKEESQLEDGQEDEEEDRRDEGELDEGLPGTSMAFSTVVPKGRGA